MMDLVARPGMPFGLPTFARHFRGGFPMIKQMEESSLPFASLLIDARSAGGLRRL